MLRFLRKYNKYILAVFGTILLVTFLVGTAITRLLAGMGQTGAEWATLGPDGDESLTATDLEQARRELRLLSAIGWPVPLYGNLDRPEHWFLLVREAQSAGLVGGAAASPLAQSGDTLAQLAQLSGENPRFILQTHAKLAGVSSVIGLYMGDSPYSLQILTSRYSDRRFKHLAQDRFHQVTAQVVVLEASPPDEPRAFTEAQLAEQMDKYAEDLPGAGEMGFGYRLPDRAKIEWLVVSADSVRAVIVDSDELNPVALRKHWRENADRLGQPQPNADVPEAVRNDLLETRTEQNLKKVSQFAYTQLRLDQRTHQQDGGPGMSFTDLALSIQKRFGVSLPKYHATGGRWLWSKDDLAELEGIGQATTAKFGQFPTSLGVLVMSASEFGGNDTMPIRQGVAGPPLDGPDGSIYFFRITDADPSRPPRSIDEVRDALIADLGRLEVYQDLVESTAVIERQARQEGLLAVALANDTVVERASTFSTASAIALPKIGVQEATIQMIVDRARSLPPDQPIDELTEQQRTFVVPVEDRLALLVVRLIRQRPLTESAYTQQGRGLLRILIMQPEVQERRTEAVEAFAFDALAARHNFKFALDTATTQPDSDQPDQSSQ